MNKVHKLESALLNMTRQLAFIKSELLKSEAEVSRLKSTEKNYFKALRTIESLENEEVQPVKEVEILEGFTPIHV